MRYNTSAYIDWPAVWRMAKEIGEFILAVIVVLILLLIAAVIIVPLALVLMSESGV